MRTGVVIAILIGIIFVVVAFWRIQGASKEGLFIEALRNGEIQMTVVELRDKVWTDEEFKTVKILKLPSSAGPQQALSRAVHYGGNYTINSQQYSYQAYITDLETGAVHIFGYRRHEPRKWVWVIIHPDSIKERIESMQKESGR